MLLFWFLSSFLYLYFSCHKFDVQKSWKCKTSIKQKMRRGWFQIKKKKLKTRKKYGFWIIFSSLHVLVKLFLDTITCYPWFLSLINLKCNFDVWIVNAKFFVNLEKSIDLTINTLVAYVCILYLARPPKTNPDLFFNLLYFKFTF